MSTHNIGFYEEISKIITYVSSNIIKYAPYFFCWVGYYVQVGLSVLDPFQTLQNEDLAEW